MAGQVQESNSNLTTIKYSQMIEEQGQQKNLIVKTKKSEISLAASEDENWDVAQ